MTKRRIIIASVILVLAVLSAVAGILTRAAAKRRSIKSPAPQPKQYRMFFGAMGTRACCTFYTTDPQKAEKAFAAVEREFDRVAKACNIHDHKSELSRLNREAGKRFFVCSDLLWRILIEARRAYKASNGAFDITIKPLMDLRGFYRKQDKIPSAAEIAETLERVGMDKVEWDDARHAVHFTVPGMAFDLGGVAKGHALDLAAAAVKKIGIRCGVIDLGGNLYLLPDPPPGKAFYNIGIRSPSGKGDSKTVLELPGSCAVATSGSYERFVELEGKRYGHIVDPATGDAPYLNRSATAVAPTAIESDWLSSTVFLRGEEIIPRLEKLVPGAKFTLTTADK